MSKTPDIDGFAHLLPAIMFYEPGKNHFQRDAMQRIGGYLVSHVSARRFYFSWGNSENTGTAGIS
jgi:hypothetical protein